jgi:SPP1 family predicted phage head-tail adaptor
MIRAGKLDRTITIENAVTVLDDAGTPVQEWTPAVVLRAELLNEVTDEQERQLGPVSDRMIAFRTRYVRGISVADRIEYEGEYYNLKSIKEIGRRRGLELKAERLGP